MRFSWYVGIVLSGLCCTVSIASSCSCNPLCFDACRSQSPQIQLCAARSSSAGKKANEAAATGKPVANDGKYENYFEFSKPLRLVLPHHVGHSFPDLMGEALYIINA